LTEVCHSHMVLYNDLQKRRNEKKSNTLFNYLCSTTVEFLVYDKALSFKMKLCLMWRLYNKRQIPNILTPSS
jgi:hypothetical protein